MELDFTSVETSMGVTSKPKECGRSPPGILNSRPTSTVDNQTTGVVWQSKIHKINACMYNIQEYMQAPLRRWPKGGNKKAKRRRCIKGSMCSRREPTKPIQTHIRDVTSRTLEVFIVARNNGAAAAS